MAETCLELDRRRVLAFRAIGHGLAHRRPRSEVVDAVAVIGLRRTKNAGLSLAARVASAAADLARGLADALADGRLVAFYGPRGTVTMGPSEDLGVFTVGAAPTDEASVRAGLPGAFVKQLDAAGVSAWGSLQAVIDAVRTVLADGPMPRGEVAQAVTRALPRSLTPPCRGRCPDPHVEDSLFRLAGVCGAMRFDGEDMLVGVEPGACGSPDACRAELVRRYLRAHGPSKPAALAAWAGVSVADARASLDAMPGDVVPVRVDGRDAGVLLRADAEGAATAHVEGVRFLPPFDPFLLDRDRALLVPARGAQKVVWRASGNPGVVLVDAEPVATWRTRKRELVIEPLDPGRPLDPARLEDEASRITGAASA